MPFQKNYKFRAVLNGRGGDNFRIFLDRLIKKKLIFEIETCINIGISCFETIILYFPLFSKTIPLYLFYFEF